MEKLQKIAQALAQQGQPELAKEVADISLMAKAAGWVSGPTRSKMNDIKFILDTIARLQQSVSSDYNDYHRTNTLGDPQAELLYHIATHLQKASAELTKASQKIDHLK